MKEGEKGAACEVFGRNGKCVQSFGWEIGMCRWEINICTYDKDTWISFEAP
jgi:hypothetical protein